MRMTAHEVCGGSIAEPVLRSTRRREPGAPALARGGREDLPGVSDEGLTPAPDTRVYNLASGQRPAASGQRHELRPAGGRPA